MIPTDYIGLENYIPLLSQLLAQSPSVMSQESIDQRLWLEGNDRRERDTGSGTMRILLTNVGQ